jgi:hypothetical protein
MARRIQAGRKRWRGSGWLLAAALILFMSLVIYRSFHVAGYRCSICVSFRGQSACTAVEGPTEHEARSGAINNACAQLVSGVTDSLACERTQPTKLDCSSMN